MAATGSDHKSMIELALAVTGQAAVDGLSKSTANLKALIGEAGLAFGRGEITAEEFEASVRKLGGQLERETALLERVKIATVDTADAVEAAMADIAESSDRGARGIAKFGDAQDRATAAKKGGAQALIELSRGLQDFQAAGLVGISNNIEGLALSIGKFAGGGVSLAAVLASPAGIVAGLTLLTTAAIAGGPTVKAYFDALINGSNKVPEAADNLQRMEDRIKGNNKALDELREKQSLTNDELAEFNRLTAETTRLEKEAAAEKAKRQRIEAAVNAPSDAQQERAKEFKDALDGQGGAFLEQLKRAYAAEGERNIQREAARRQKEIDQLFRSGAGNDELMAAEKKRAADMAVFARTQREGSDRLAENTFDRLLQGDERAGAIVDRLQVGGGGVGLANVNERFKKAIRAKVEAEIEKAQKELDQAVEQTTKAEKKVESFEDMTDRISRGIVEAADKGEAERIAKRDKAAQGDMTKDAREARKHRDETVKNIADNTPLDELATQAAARARAVGGVVDPRTGRVDRKADPFVALSEDLLRNVRKVDPSLSQPEAQDVAVTMARQAFARVDESNRDNQMALNASNAALSPAQKTQAAAQMTLQSVNAILARVQALEATANQLNRDASATHAAVVSRRPTFQQRVPTR